MRPNYELAKKEAIFIALPLLILFIVKLLQQDLIGFIKVSDFSLAVAIMYGQLLAKTLDIPDKVKKNNGKFSTVQVKIFAFSMLSLTMYIGLQLLPDVQEYLYWFQIITFLIALFYYIPISTLMEDMKNNK
ncbi:hypothetical protein L4D17_00130 [Vibrio splendidus]|uniref:hypothetical protein n=1 Tax=Vibrio splendidus TaxID=29497 RepID=UPI00354E2126